MVLFERNLLHNAKTYYGRRCNAEKDCSSEFCRMMYLEFRLDFGLFFSRNALSFFQYYLVRKESGDFTLVLG